MKRVGAAAIVALACQVAVFAPSGAAVPSKGNCHMGSCSWFNEMSRSVVQEDRRGKLIKLVLRGGASYHSGHYPARYSKAVNIKWDAHPHEVYVFCSKSLPAVMLGEDGSYQVDVLDFAGAVPDVLISSAEVYTATCHGRGANWASNTFARRFGYKKLPDGADNVSVSDPRQIFGHVR